MSIRVTTEEVNQILDEAASKDLTPFIALASLVVDEELETLDVLSVSRLKEIERWLSAHFYCVMDPRAQSESAGVSASYEGSAGQGLSRTRYGQQAIRLDTTCTLAKIDLADGSGAGEAEFDHLEQLTGID